MNCNLHTITNNYIPTRQRLLNDHDKFDLDAWLQQMTFNEIMQNPNSYFENVYITNFDLIHHQCSSDKLTHDKNYYETLFNERLNSQIINVNDKDNFVSAAINCERKDVNIENKIYENHFNRKLFREKLNKDGVFLSNMRRKKYSDDCKSLPF